MESCQRVSFFGQLPSWLVKKLCANAEYIQYQPGAIIFREGENGACLYIIFSGSVSIHKAETGRKSSIIHNFRTRRSHTKAGEFITDVRELKDRVHVERYGKLLSCLTSGDSFGEVFRINIFRSLSLPLSVTSLYLSIFLQCLMKCTNHPPFPPPLRFPK